MSADVVSCPKHPAQTAFARCQRCDRPVCSYCLPDGGTACDECHAADEGRADIPWDRTGLALPLRFFRTIATVLSEPSIAFERMPRDAWGRALVFAGLMWFLAGCVTVLLVTPLAMLQIGRFSGSIRVDALAQMGGLLCGAVMAPFLAVAVGLGLVVFLASVFHTAVMVMGGRGGFSTSLRAVSYAQAFVLCLPVFFVSGAPLGLAWLLGSVGSVFMMAHLTVVSSATARGAHGMDGRRSWIVGAAAPALVVLLGLSTLAMVYQVSDALEPDRSPGRYAAPIAE